MHRAELSRRWRCCNSCRGGRANAQRPCALSFARMWRLTLQIFARNFKMQPVKTHPLINTGACVRACVLEAAQAKQPSRGPPSGSRPLFRPLGQDAFQQRRTRARTRGRLGRWSLLPTGGRGGGGGGEWMKVRGRASPGCRPTRCSQKEPLCSHSRCRRRPEGRKPSVDAFRALFTAPSRYPEASARFQPVSGARKSWLDLIGPEDQSEVPAEGFFFCLLQI